MKTIEKISKGEAIMVFSRKLAWGGVIALGLISLAGCGEEPKNEYGETPTEEKLNRQAEEEGAREGKALADQMKSTRADGQ